MTSDSELNTDSLIVNHLSNHLMDLVGIFRFQVVKLKSKYDIGDAFYTKEVQRRVKEWNK